MATPAVSAHSHGVRMARNRPSRARRSGKSPKFVVHKHSAQRPCYDLLIEADGALRSWAVPGGLSADPRQKRLAMPAAQHPREYGGFEGVVDGGRRGADAMIVWDCGPYRNLSERGGKRVTIEDALGSGHALVWLEGEKLRGGYELTRLACGEGEHWIVVKHRDEEADSSCDPVRTQPESVLSGRTVEQVRGEAP